MSPNNISLFSVLTTAEKSSPFILNLIVERSAFPVPLDIVATPKSLNTKAVFRVAKFFKAMSVKRFVFRKAESNTVNTFCSPPINSLRYG